MAESSRGWGVREWLAERARDAIGFVADAADPTRVQKRRAAERAERAEQIGREALRELERERQWFLDECREDGAAVEAFDGATMATGVPEARLTEGQRLGFTLTRPGARKNGTVSIVCDTSDPGAAGAVVARQRVAAAQAKDEAERAALAGADGGGG